MIMLFFRRQTGNEVRMFHSSARCLLLLIIVLFSPLLAAAADSGDGTLRVVRPIIRAEQDQPELCLEFDHPLVLQRLGKLASAIHLKAEGKNIPLSSRLLDVTGSELCVRLPDHRTTYSIILSDIRGQKGEQLGNPYSLSFDVPARHSNLAFVNNDSDEGVVRTPSMKPRLRAINVSDVKLELFRINDPAHMAEAWLRRRQTLLAPSETTTFARTNGQLVWQGQIKFDSGPDTLTDQDIILDDKITGLANGLYLIVASAPDLREKATDLAPIAASWMLRSNLRIHMVPYDNGFHAFAANADLSATFAGTQFNLLDHQQKTITKGYADEHGIVYLEPPTDKRADAAVLVASNSSGDYDFIDMTVAKSTPVVLPSAEADIVLDQTVYSPGGPANINLVAHDIHNHPIAVGESELSILRPDHTRLAAVPVSPTTSGLASVTMDVPVENGVWPVQWQQKDGRILGESILRVSHNPEAPIVDIMSDQTVAASDSTVNLIISSRNPDIRPVPYIAGYVEAVWMAADHKIPGWQDYHFGSGSIPAHKPQRVASFITGPDGNVRLPIELQPPDDATGLLSVTFRVVTDAAAGARDIAERTLLVRQSNLMVGVRPSESNGHFPENSLAQFDFVVLNRNGNPEPVQNLSAHIYEVGRNFDWYQADGSWQYKAQQQQRLLGGDDLDVGADGRAHMQWPVTAGTYRLDVTDAEGGIVTSLDFRSGWRGGNTDRTARNDLQLSPTHTTLAVGKPETISFNLEHAAMVTTIIVDDHTRMVTQEFRPKGVNHMLVTATPDWGNHVLVDIEARSISTELNGRVVIAGGSLTLPVEKQHADIKKQMSAKPALSTRMPSIRANTTDANDENPVISAVTEYQMAPQQEQSLTAATNKKNRSTVDQAYIVASTIPLSGVLQALDAAISQTPYTTHEIINWLSVVRRWRTVIVSTKRLSDAMLHQREQELIARLLLRQQVDGSFAAEASAIGGDLNSTAAAVSELSTHPMPGLRPNVERGGQWLKNRLDNIWFDDRERNARPAAYVALAAAGRIDADNLHYFSDSSANKLSPLAAVTLATAFAKLNDKDKAANWLSAAHIATASPDIDLALLPLLAENQFFDAGTLDAALTKQAKHSDDPIALLVATAHRLDRSGVWHLAINGVDKSGKGAAIFSLSSKADIALRNLSDQPLYLLHASVAKSTHNNIAATRHIFRPDGGEVIGNLVPNQTYIVVIEGDESAKPKPPLLVRDDARGVLRPVSCALSDAGGNSTLVWLPQLSDTLNCEVAGDVIHIALPALKSGQSSWRTAYIARAEAQSMKGMPTPQLRPISDGRDVQSR
jgi:hypothetical protein